MVPFRGNCLVYRAELMRFHGAWGEATDEDGTLHTLHRVTDPGALEAVHDALADAELLIADGHHRYETALRYRDERRAAEGDREGDRPYDFAPVYLANRRDPASGFRPPILKALAIGLVPVALIALATRVDFLRSSLLTQPLTGPQWLACLGLAPALPVTIELSKLLRRRAGSSDERREARP